MLNFTMSHLLGEVPDGATIIKFDICKFWLLSIEGWSLYSGA